jgi:hypothetical protein
MMVAKKVVIRDVIIKFNVAMLDNDDNDMITHAHHCLLLFSTHLV